MTIHELKTDPQPFDAIVQGLKTFEIRLNDRKFQVRDYLRLRRTLHSGAEMKKGLPLVYTGDEVLVRVTHVLEGQYGLRPGWCVLSIKVFV